MKRVVVACWTSETAWKSRCPHARSSARDEGASISSAACMRNVNRMLPRSSNSFRIWYSLKPCSYRSSPSARAW
jgi:hypothetical protein